MEILNDYVLEKTEDGHILILYVNSNETEFAKEILDSSKEISKDLKTWIIHWSKTQVPKAKIHTIRIMLGTFLLVSIAIPMQYNTLVNNPTQISQVYAQTNEKFNMAYLYFGSPNTHVDAVLNTNHSIQVISPSYFNLDDEGNLELTSLVNTNFINEMHKNNIKVVPFLSNHWDQEKGIKALENRTQLVSDLFAAIEKYNLDGVNIDIENVTPEQREIYVDLIKHLREKLPKQKEVSVAVAPNPYNWTGGWQGSYDYSGLGKYADYLMIMTYDESYFGSNPGPVASHNFMENSIKYALKYVPAKKIVLGISFYGRYWNDEQNIKGNGIHLTKIKEILDTYENKVTYDKNFQAPKAEVTIKKSDPPIYVFGEPLKPGTYTIWYENSDSIKDKLLLVQKYNIKGTGNWSLGQEVSDVWSYYNLWLNGKYFEDIGQSWAKDDILTVVNKNLMKGVSDTKFAPDDALTRAQAATLMVRALDLKITNNEKKTFTDVPSSHWAKENIDIIVENNIMEGMGNGLFSPDEPLTREQMAMLLYRVIDLAENNEIGDAIFTDLTSERWSYEAINSMTKLGIYKGYPDHTFRPTQAMIRQEVAVLMNRLEALKIFI